MATENQHHFVFYKKLTFSLISLVLIGLILIYGKSIILPLLFAILLANLLLPLTSFFGRKGFNRVLAILTPLVAAILVGGTIVFFLSNQVAGFLDDVPALREKTTTLTNSFQKWVDENVHIAVRKQNQYIKETKENLKEQAPKLVGLTFTSMIGVLAYVILVPIYTFLILFYKKTIKSFLVAIFKNGSPQKVNEVLDESTSVAQQFILGLLIETTIVFTLNVIGFLILGIKYAVFLALLAALLNLIPYIGMLVANLICMVITLISSDSPADAIWVGVILALVQLFDNNFGMPVIVGNKVRINALVTILGVLLGGALCGIPGMFLAIPGLAVLKIISDKVPELKPWGMLLGDEHTPSSRKTKFVLIKPKHKVVNQ